MKIRESRNKEKARKDLFSSESAASTVIAAVLLLSIIFTIFAVVRIAYVPEWKTDAEQSHMSEVQRDMTELKSTADMITLLQSSNSNSSPIDFSLTVPPVTVPISMGGGEIPILEPSKSSGTLSINIENFTMIITPKNSDDIVIYGGITYSSNNREYVDQIIRYENGALILNQDNNRSVMKQPPSFNITKDGEYYNVIIRTINVTGERNSISSDTGISLTLTDDDSNLLPIKDVDSFSCTILTNYPNAWISYLKKIAEDAKLTYETKYEKNESKVYFKFFTSGKDQHFRLHISQSSIKADLGAVNSLDYTSPRKGKLPVANFSSNVTSGYAPLFVQFTDQSESTTKRVWNFGDGSDNSYDQNPIHTYSKAGNYTVTLIASNENDTNSAYYTVNVSQLRNG